MLIETRKERSILREIEEMFGVKGRCLCADGAQASCEFDDCPRLRLEAEAVPQGDTGQRLDRLSRLRLMQIAANSGIRFSSRWTKARLKAAILAAVSDVPSAEIR